MPSPPPIDLPEGPRFALSGRVVTMDPSSRVLPRGVVYVDRGAIVAVQDGGAPRPEGFKDTPIVSTGGTLFPGLIELHNHLSYDALPLWDVPRKFENRDQWSRTAEYGRLVSGPMKVLGRTEGLLPAVVRYVECKCLLGGVTTSQGIELFSNRGARRYYRGIVRNVEQTDDPALPEATARIADVEARSRQRFVARLLRQTCLLLHLSEGTDRRARDHFEALRIQGREWAITPALAGIHCAALKRVDFKILGRRGGSMVWSPMSNLLLYGATAHAWEARERGVRIGLGSDWSPSGSKNLLGELKVARLVSDAMDGGFSDRDIVGMATREAAAILKWEGALGSIQPGLRADLLVIDGVRGDAYSNLLHADETSIRLVVINGVARFGHRRLMQRLRTSGESVGVGGRSRILNLAHENADPAVGVITLAQARRRLEDALAQLPRLAADLEAGRAGPAGTRARRMAALPGPPVWFIALDELEQTGMELRPRLPLPGRNAPTGPSLRAARATVPLSQALKPLALDPLTVADDASYLDRIRKQQVLPAFVREELKHLY